MAKTSIVRVVSWTRIDQTKIGHISHEISNNQWKKLNNLIFVHFCLTLFCFWRKIRWNYLDAKIILKQLSFRIYYVITKLYWSFLFQAKLKVGDMILAVNTESFLDITYDEVGIFSDNRKSNWQPKLSGWIQSTMQQNTVDLSEK